MKKILIATLGQSPGVITEAIDQLKNIKLDEVIILHTKDYEIIESAEYLKTHINIYYGGNISCILRRIETFEDLRDKQSVESFTKICEDLFENEKNNEIYVCISGGRKGASGLLGIIAHKYGAKEIFHIIPEEEDIEKKWKDIKSFKDNKEQMEKILHPDLNRIFYVSLPVEKTLSTWLTEKTADGFFNKNNYPGAVKMYAELEKILRDPRNVQIKCFLASTYLLLEKFEFEKGLKRLRETLDLINQYTIFESIKNKIEKQIEWLDILNKDKDKKFFDRIKDRDYFKSIVLFLFEKANRNAENEMYDYGILCLYRILELISQHYLAEHNIDTENVEINKISDEVKKTFKELKKEIIGSYSEIPEKIALLDSWILLVALKNNNFKKEDLKTLKETLPIRNLLWIEHKDLPARKENFNKLKSYVENICKKLIENYDEEKEKYAFCKF